MAHTPIIILFALVASSLYCMQPGQDCFFNGELITQQEAQSRMAKMTSEKRRPKAFAKNKLEK